MPDQSPPSDSPSTPTHSRLVAEERVPFSAELASINLTALRAACSRLFDKSARAVFLLGLDLDEVIVDRFLECRDGEESTFRIPLVSLTDRDALIRAIPPERSAGARITGIVAAVIANTPGFGLP